MLNRQVVRFLRQYLEGTARHLERRFFHHRVQDMTVEHLDGRVVTFDDGIFANVAA